MSFIKEHQKLFLFIIVFASIALLSLLAIIGTKTTKEEEVVASIVKEETTTKIEETLDTFYVDVKGAVVNPGVYEVSNGSIVKDAIDLAGGLKKDAVTSNINLSQKLTSEMVIYIFSKSELKTTTAPILTDTSCTTNVISVQTPTTTTTSKIVDQTVSGTTTTSQSKVNINSASKEELMTLSGVGSSKADAIIAYRINNNFKSIEDIMNVSGIGESAFAKIKDNITV